MKRSKPISFSQSWRLNRRGFFQWIDRHSTTGVLALSIVSFLSAFIGVTLTVDAQETKSSRLATAFNWFTDKFYEAAQVLLLNMESHQGDFNFCIGVARITSVALIGLVAFKAIRKLFKDSLINLKLLFPSADSVFIGGLGRIGLELARQKLAEGKQVIVQEIAESNFWTQRAEDLGAIVVEGDVTDLDGLRRFILRKASEVHLVTGNDLTNVNALANIKKIRSEALDSLGPCDCHVHIEDPALHRSVLRCIIESNCTDDPDFRILPFNIYHETACQLAIEKLTPIRPRRGEVALYVIVGFEQMGNAMLKELVEFAHFENQKRSRILVLVPPADSTEPGQAAEQAYRNCISQWERMTPRFVHSDLTQVSFEPALDDWNCQMARPEVVNNDPPDTIEVEYAANVHFCELSSGQSISATEARQLAKLAGAVEAAETSVKPAVLFCLEEDDLNFRLATELNDHWQDFEGINQPIKTDSPTWEEDRELLTRQTEYEIPIFVFLPRSKPMREILSESNERFLLHPFGEVNEGLRRAHDDLIETVAIDVAYDYYLSNTQDQPPVDRDGYLSIWQSKPYWDQLSNRNAAEHAHIKMQILGYTMAANCDEPGSGAISFESFDHTDKVMLALVEHNRWMAERLLMGWCYGAKINQPPQRPSMCSKADLPEPELLKDYRQIEKVFECLKNRGVLFFRNNKS